MTMESVNHDVKIGVLGGSGLYHLDHLKFLTEVYPETPWGFPSDKIKICQTEKGHKIAFLSRHGPGHSLNPSEVPYKANIAALKHLGCKIILAFSAVGSLREEIEPRHFVLPNQVIDRTKSIRSSTFFEEGIVAHLPFADPFSNSLIDVIQKAATEISALKMHTEKTLVVMEGPAFSTRAESMLYRSWGCDIINMSTLPEAKLAREAGMHYAVICMATDYDCWRVGEEDVSVQQVLEVLKDNSGNAKLLLEYVLPLLEESQLETPPSVQSSIITHPEQRSKEALKNLEYLFDSL